MQIPTGNRLTKSDPHMRTSTRSALSAVRRRQHDFDFRSRPSSARCGGRSAKVIPMGKIVSLRSSKMGRVSVPYYVVKQRRNGNLQGYWQPTKKMIALGARLVPCGSDGPEAWAKAARAYAEWKAGKRRDRRRGPAFEKERSPPPSRNIERLMRGQIRARGRARIGCAAGNISNPPSVTFGPLSSPWLN